VSLKFDLRGVPDDLPPGKYATRVSDESRWEGNDITIILDYRGPYDPEDPCLIPFTKEEPAAALERELVGDEREQTNT
jgi:hypothetical protein